jgi:hypothetical protein
MSNKNLKEGGERAFLQKTQLDMSWTGDGHLHLENIILAVTLFSRIFTGEGTSRIHGLRYRTQRSKARAAARIDTLPSLDEGERQDVLYYDGSLKLLAVCTVWFVVSVRRDAQLQATLNTSCWHKAFVLYMM